jgi:hypothetical protein
MSVLLLLLLLENVMSRTHYITRNWQVIMSQTLPYNTTYPVKSTTSLCHFLSSIWFHYRLISLTINHPYTQGLHLSKGFEVRNKTIAWLNLLRASNSCRPVLEVSRLNYFLWSISGRRLLKPQFFLVNVKYLIVLYETLSTHLQLSQLFFCRRPHKFKYTFWKIILVKNI